MDIRHAAWASVDIGMAASMMAKTCKGMLKHICKASGYQASATVYGAARETKHLSWIIEKGKKKKKKKRKC